MSTAEYRGISAWKFFFSFFCIPHAPEQTLVEV
jgi:hypothetical protein